MKNINKLFTTFFLVIIISCNGEIESITINTPTIQCSMCQATIEKGLSKLNGVSRSKVDLKSKTTIVSYSADKTNLDKIERAISDLGYEANSIKADEKAYDELLPCCKIGGMDKSITINTPTIQCGMCQATIEKGLSKLNGVSSSKVDLKSKTTIVSYSADKTNLDKIERAISDLGYQANSTRADEKAYDELFPCCKIGGMDKK